MELSAIKPKQLVLTMLGANPDGRLTVNRLIEAGRLFGIEPAALRVSLGRLVKQGLLVSPTRGTYEAAAQVHALNKRLRSWRTVEDVLTDWTGAWLIAHVSHLGRADKTQLARRERALRLFGFREDESGVWIRPANLVDPLQKTAARLQDIGLEAESLLISATDVSGPDDFDPAKLWDRAKIETGYQDLIGAMDDVSRHAKDTAIEDLARKTLLLGDQVIKHINLDPLLPKELVDTRLRRKLIERRIKFDELGIKTWVDFPPRP